MKEKTAQQLLQKVVDDYSQIADEFAQTRKNEWKEFEMFLPYIKDNMKVLDLGCGSGRFLDFLNKHRKVQYLGVDKCRNLIENAKDHHEKAKFIEADMLDLPIENESIDIVASIAALHHIPSKQLKKKALKEIRRVLKKKGILVLSVWNLNQPKYKKYIWEARLRWFTSFGKYQPRDTFIPWGKSGVKRYYYAFRPKVLKKLLHNLEFEILEEKIGNNIIFICQKS